MRESIFEETAKGKVSRHVLLTILLALSKIEFSLRLIDLI